MSEFKTEVIKRIVKIEEQLNQLKQQKKIDNKCIKHLENKIMSIEKKNNLKIIASEN